MKRSVLRIVYVVIYVLWLIPAGGTHAAQIDSVFDQIDLLVDVRHEIINSFVEKPDEQAMIEAAVRSMVNSLGDRYTIFLTADEIEPFDMRIRGSFSGVGAEIDIHDDRLRIVTPLEDSPAWRAGVLAGDTVLEIDGETTRGITLAKAVKRLTGPVGTQVTVKVRHESGDEEVIIITRAKINVQTVRGLHRDAQGHWDYMLDPVNRIGYLRVTQFTAVTAQNIRIALEQLLAQDVRGLILDLRFNPGGLLESAVQVCDMFLQKGQRIVSTKGRRTPEQIMQATDQTLAAMLPIVVLANGGSASAAEIVTGALSDNHRAKFIGSRTFGKGSVQQVKMLDTGLGALKITNAYYYLPSGRMIHRRKDSKVWGVDPDDGFYVSMTPDQIREMIKIRREGDILKAHAQSVDGQAITPKWIGSSLADPQLAAGLTALLGQLDEGDWPQVGQAGASVLVRQSQRANLLNQRDLIQERLEQIELELAKLNGEAAKGTEVELPIADLGQGPEPESSLLPEVAPSEPAASPVPVDQEELEPLLEQEVVPEPKQDEDHSSSPDLPDPKATGP